MHFWQYPLEHFPQINKQLEHNTFKHEGHLSVFIFVEQEQWNTLDAIKN